MLKYPCLVLDHDDTVVASEVAVNYPCFLLALEKFRPGQTMDLESFRHWCYQPGFTALLLEKFQFTPQEAEEEFRMWVEYAKDHIPPVYDGIRDLIWEQKRQGGLVCVVSHSSSETILRDYETHIGLLPDAIYDWNLPKEQRKPSPWPLRDIMAKYGLSPAQMLVVDDLKTGVEMAANAGVQCAFAGWSKQDLPQVHRDMSKICHHCFDTVTQLREFLFGS